MGYLRCSGCGGDFKGRPYAHGVHCWCEDCAPAFLVEERERRRRRRRDRPSPAMVAEVTERDGGRCTYCGEVPERPEMDHVVPISRGGKTVVGNLALACESCNKSKSDRTPDEWEGRNG